MSPAFFALMLVACLLLFLRGRRRGKLSLAVIDHLAILTERGLPLGPGLIALAKERSESWGRRARKDANAIRGIAERLDATGSIADALATQPRFFSAETVSFIRVAEAKGALPEAFAVLRREEEDRENFSSRLLERSFYPIVQTWFIIGCATFLAVFIEPKFQEVIETIGETPPDFEAIDVVTVAFAAAALVSIGVLGFVLEKGVVARLLLGIGARLACATPILSKPMRRFFHARWMARAGALLAAGATLPEAMEDVAKTRGPHARALGRAALVAKEGGSLAKVLDSALGRYATELGVPVLLAVQTQGIAEAFSSAARRVGALSIRRLDVIGQIARPIPVALAGAVVAAHSWAVWSSILIVQGVTLKGWKP